MRPAHCLPLLALSILPGCLTPLVWDGYGQDHWIHREERAELRVTDAGITEGPDGELLLAYESCNPLPAPWAGRLRERGWLALAGDGDALVARELLAGRPDLVVTSSSVQLVIEVPDPLDLGARAELWVEGVVGPHGARRLTGKELAAARTVVADYDLDTPPVLGACIEAVARTQARAWGAAAGLDCRVAGRWEVLGWMARGTRGLAGLPEKPADPVAHLESLADVQLLLEGVAETGGEIHLLVPADLAFLLQRVEYRGYPAPHFVHRSTWLPSVRGVPLESRYRIAALIGLTVTTRIREHVRNDGFGDTLWRVLLTPFTAVADAALGLAVGAVAIWSGMESDC